MTDTGRPSGYDKDYHPAQIIELMSKGMLDCDIYADFRISKTTFYRWLRDYPEFKEAYEIGLPMCEKAAIMDPLREMVSSKNEKGYKALSHIARNKFDHDRQGPQTVHNTQINVGSVNITNKEEFDKLATEVKENLIDLNVVDVDFLELKDDESDSV